MLESADEQEREAVGAESSRILAAGGVFENIVASGISRKHCIAVPILVSAGAAASIRVGGSAPTLHIGISVDCADSTGVKDSCPCLAYIKCLKSISQDSKVAAAVLGLLN